MNKLGLIAVASSLALLVQGCALDTFDPKPDDPAYAPALPQEI